MTENDEKTKQDEEEIAWEMYHRIEKGEACPHCLSLNLLREGRCITCLKCGWSKCDL